MWTTSPVSAVKEDRAHKDRLINLLPEINLFSSRPIQDYADILILNRSKVLNCWGQDSRLSLTVLGFIALNAGDKFENAANTINCFSLAKTRWLILNTRNFTKARMKKNWHIIFNIEHDFICF